MNSLDFLLSQDSPFENKKSSEFDLRDLQITREAYEKSYTYARLVVNEAKRSMECGGYLIAPKDSKERIVTDTFLARNQDVSSSLFEVNAEDVIKTGKEINEMDYKVLGWWHSHGRMPAFFSGTDYKGQITLLNQISAFNYVPLPDEKRLGNLEVISENGNLIFFDKKNPTRKYVLGLEGNLKNLENVSVKDFTIQKEKRIGFTYGLVVNVSYNKKIRKPYVEIGTRDLCLDCGHSRDKSVKGYVSFFGDGNFEINEEELRKEVKERIHWKKPRYFHFLKDNQLSEGNLTLRNFYGAGFREDLDSGLSFPITKKNNTEDSGGKDLGGEDEI